MSGGRSDEFSARMAENAAMLYVAIIAGVILFQLCLIACPPWGPVTAVPLALYSVLGASL